jgi:DNA-directed RNA polymerase specialized sigma24 family protein
VNRAAKAPIETDEYADMVVRVLSAFGKRVAMGDPEDLARFREVIDGAENDLRRAVIGLRAQGFSDHDLARVLGVTRQAISQRFPRKVILPPNERTEAG